MKLTLEKVNTAPDSSFAVEHNIVPWFNSPWHFHPETEIILIEQGTGTLFAGDCIRSFSPGALAILGSGLPHVWMNDAVYHQRGSSLVAESVVIKFHPSFAGNFFELPETVAIRTLLKKASRGILFYGDMKQMLTGKVRQMPSLHGFDRLLCLIELLGCMARTDENEREYLASKGYVSVPLTGEDSERMDKVYKYVMNHFTEEISLEKIAGIASMCPTSFCRYFRKHARKTFSQFVNEIRIGYACRLLIETGLSVAEISYRAGFRYQSNFFKQFKTFLRMTPYEYREKYWTLNHDRESV